MWHQNTDTSFYIAKWNYYQNICGKVTLMENVLKLAKSVVKFSQIISKTAKNVMNLP